MQLNQHQRTRQTRHPLMDEFNEAKARFSRRPRKPQLRSRWTVVNGTLVCQWTTEC